MAFSHYLSLVLSLFLSLLPSTFGAVYKGFNYGAGIDFLTSFRTAQTLVGASGFTSARLYTMIEANTTNSPTSAIPAAIATRTSLLLGLSCSAGDLAFENETIALTAAIQAYGQPFVDLIAGISVGSEDLYRTSPVGILNHSPPGDNVPNIVKYINQTRTVIKNTSSGIAKGKPVGHVDTWQMWGNAPNIASVIAAVDFVGMDAYPYWQSNDTNTANNGQELFEQAYQATLAAAGGKPVWVTETGWPLNGSTFGQAVPNVANAEWYWYEVGCLMLFNKVNTWWNKLEDDSTVGGGPSFGIVDSNSNTTALFDLSCLGNRTFSKPMTTEAAQTTSLADPGTTEELETTVTSPPGPDTVTITARPTVGADSTTRITSTVIVTNASSIASGKSSNTANNSYNVKRGSWVCLFAFYQVIFHILD
ncbi:MAG: hypothetical protein Q9201_005231 [Fulgogasparrea decipioides]